jgi:hypothetical protein
MLQKTSLAFKLSSTSGTANSRHMYGVAVDEEELWKMRQPSDEDESLEASR